MRRPVWRLHIGQSSWCSCLDFVFSCRLATSVAISRSFFFHRSLSISGQKTLNVEPSTLNVDPFLSPTKIRRAFFHKCTNAFFVILGPTTPQVSFRLTVEHSPEIDSRGHVDVRLHVAIAHQRA